MTTLKSEEPVLSAGTGDSYQVQKRLKERVIPEAIEGGASIRIINKDSEYLLDWAAARNLNPETHKAAHDLFVSASEDGLSELDYAA